MKSLLSLVVAMTMLVASPALAGHHSNPNWPNPPPHKNPNWVQMHVWHHSCPVGYTLVHKPGWGAGRGHSCVPSV